MIGSILLTLALVAGLASTIMYFLSFRGQENTLKVARISYHAMAILVIVAATLFLQAIITHQYQYKYIYEYSGSGLSLGLLISTFYAGQEGSFFLWTFFTVVIGLLLQQYASRRGDLEPRVMSVYTLAASFLLMMVSPMLKNPFAYIWAEPNFIAASNINPAILNMPFMQSFFFTDGNSGQAFIKMSSELYTTLQKSGIAINDFIVQGKGLNPLLQNFWMQIHPPILFMGFALSTVPFAFAMSALMKNEYKDWIRQAFPWVLAGSMVLGLAIMLGGYWAYGVLGWGGYWGWDPVENSSLVPWLIGVASIHTMLVQRKSLARHETDGIGEFARTNLVLCIMTYVLVLYSTFLTRSGILGDASVHAFTDPGRSVYVFLVILILSFTILGIGMMIYRWRYLSKQVEAYKNLLNRELALFTGSVALIASAVIVIVGTSAPLFKTSVETKFYNDMNLPIAILIGVLNGLSLLVKWRFTEGKEVIRKSIFSVAASFVLTALMALVGGVHGLMMIILTFSSAFALFANAEVAYKIMRGNKMALGAYVAHIGIAVFLLGVVGSSVASGQKQVELPKGEPRQAFGYTLTFKGYHPVDDGQKFGFDIEVRKGNVRKVVSPVMFFSQYNNGLMREPDIISEFSKDFYVSPVNFDDGSQQSKGSQLTLNKGEAAQFEGAKITFSGFNFPKDAMNTMMSGGDFQVGARVAVEYNGKSFQTEPLMKAVSGQKEFVPVEVKDANIRIQMEGMDASGKVNLVVTKLDGKAAAMSGPKEVLSIEASVKPFINLVWTGVLVMVLGFIVSVVRRSKESLA
ncbi:MAG: cytochrome c biogenesis protein CcsA [Ignavibacteria bacterium]|jgi:cytochrome c-type biogenesis protein CcmF|nr:cytochrome c biogenesis protein CcsA [Ignavibacteria bacterium]MCU7502658.1 cytochrome c biogenesis protein CcsA [Ignavibacteria bacterium]MCU7515139.1 cytochrome c biogenesis protein CcsA [Ignavibacteria bacterium]